MPSRLLDMPSWTRWWGPGDAQGWSLGWGGVSPSTESRGAAEPRDSHWVFFWYTFVTHAQHSTVRDNLRSVGRPSHPLLHFPPAPLAPPRLEPSCYEPVFINLFYFPVPCLSVTTCSPHHFFSFKSVFDVNVNVNAASECSAVQCSAPFASGLRAPRVELSRVHQTSRTRRARRECEMRRTRHRYRI